MVNVRALAALVAPVLVAACSVASADAEPATGASPERTDVACSALTTRSDGAVLVHAPSSATDSAQNPAFIGSTLVFTVFHGGYNGGAAGLFTRDAAGAVKTLLDTGSDDHVNLPGSAYSALTNRITFSSDRNASTDNVWTANVDGTGLFKVTNLASAYEPSFSPDGSQIVFEYAPRTGNHRIARVNADGTGLVYLTDGSHDDRQPNWSPAGNGVVFQRQQGNDALLVTMKPDGTGVFVIPNVLGTDASWSPDGKYIVYSGGYYGDRDNVLVVSATGGPQIRATNSDVYDGAPSWSPDGKWIAFESGGDGTKPTSVWMIASPVTVTPAPGATPVTPPPGAAPTTPAGSTPSETAGAPFNPCAGR